MINKPYFSPFKRVPVSPVGGDKIKKIQDEYDLFWKRLNRIVDKCPEKNTAMRKLQESCMWITRAVAITNVNPMPEQHLVEETTDLAKALEKYQDGDQIPIKNSPTIIFKKKK